MTGKRDDGYHLVDMIMQTVGIYDEVRVTVFDDEAEAEKSGFVINREETADAQECSRRNIKITMKKSSDVIRGYNPGQMDASQSIPADERNLAWKAAAAVMDEFGIDRPVQIDIEKSIPAAAGMAGGSADAAAVIMAMNDICELDMSSEKMDETALKIGADVPFCLRKGTYRARGIGEELTKLNNMPKSYVVIVAPEYEVETRAVYGLLDNIQEPQHPDTEMVIAGIDDGALEKLSAGMGNILEPVTANFYPVIYSIEEELLDAGAVCAMMTGSGPTVFAVFEDMDKARTAYEEFDSHKQIGRSFMTVFVEG